MKSNRILYFCMLLLSFIFVYSYGGKIPYAFFYALLFMPLFSFVYLLAAFSSFNYTQNMDSEFIIKGDKVRLLVKLNNKSILFYPLIKITFNAFKSLSAGQSQSENVFLAPFSQKIIAFDTACNYRGRYEIELEAIEFSDFLGIIKLDRKKKQNTIITVYPKILPVNQLNQKNDLSPDALFASGKQTEDMVILSDIRKYVFGDPFKKIHWKLSAKANELMVKNFQKTAEINTLLVLDLKRNPHQKETNIIIEDKVIEALIAVIYHCLLNQIPISFSYYQKRMFSFESKDLSGFKEMHKLLAEIKFNEEFDIGTVLEEVSKDRQIRKNIFIFTSNINDDLCEQLYKMRLSGCEITLVFISASDLTGANKKNEENVLSSMSSKGVKIFEIDTNSEITAASQKTAV
jgi:uncharacterized protein (DUF58 family)